MSKKDKKTDVWMPLYIADYLADTTRLSTEQHGAYLLLIMDYWRNGPLPDDDEALANITKLSASTWRKYRHVFARLFQVSDGEWRHKRIDTEIQRAKANVAQRSEAGKASAEKRKAEREAKRKANENSTAVTTSVETDDATNCSTEDERDPQRNSKPSPSPSPIDTKNLSGKPTVIGSNQPRASEDDLPRPTEQGKIAAALRPLGIQVTPDNPFLQGWIDSGIGLAQLLTAVTQARQCKPEPEPIPARYLDTTVRRLLKPPNGTKATSLEERNQRVAQDWLPPELRQPSQPDTNSRQETDDANR